ncbi:TATE DNA Transposon [Diplonema papillatum]|nr:TATE DNA Transposon [Diplonema papillatum]
MEPALAGGEMRLIHRDARGLLSAALAPSTWARLASVHRRFRVFLSFANEELDGVVDVATGIILFVVRCMRRGDITIPSALTYVNTLVSAERRWGVNLEGSQVIRDARRALLRLGANIPERQAVPATFAEVRQALGSCRDPALRMTILFSWRAAARVGDVVRLRGKDVEIVEEGAKVKWWWTKSDPFHLGAVSAVAMTRRDRAALETLKRDAGPDGTLFPVTTARVARSLKRVNPVLTCHSLRRGACTALFRSGSSLEQVRLVSNHSSIEALLRYLPMGELERVDQAVTLSQRLY